MRRFILPVASLVAGVGIANGSQPPTYQATVLGDLASTAEVAVFHANRAGWSVGYTYGGNLPEGVHGFVASPSGDMRLLDIPDTYWDVPAAINDYGVLTGVARTGTAYNSPRWLFRCNEDGACENLGTLAGIHGEVVDINNRGEIVGSWSDGASGTWRAFRYTDDAGWEILNTTSVQSNYAADINDRGEVVGVAWHGPNEQRAWYWRDGELTDLGTLGGAYSIAYYINNQGVVVGSASTATGDRRAFRWTVEGGMDVLPLLAGAEANEAFWITDRGLIGGMQTVGTEFRAFVFSDDLGMVELETAEELSVWNAPRAMNREGVTVFPSLDTSSYEFTPFVFAPSFGLHDINNLMDGAQEFDVREPVHVTECGEIVANATGTTGPAMFQSVSVLLTPIWPEDLDRSGNTDLADFAKMQRNIGMVSDAQPEDGDLDGDGDVDLSDASALIDALHAPCR